MSDSPPKPSPAPRPSTPVHRPVSQQLALEFDAFVVAAEPFLEMARDGRPPSSAGMVLWLSERGRLHSTAQAAFVDAVARNQRALKVRVCIEIVGEVDAAVKPLK